MRENLAEVLAAPDAGTTEGGKSIDAGIIKREVPQRAKGEVKNLQREKQRITQ